MKKRKSSFKRNRNWRRKELKAIDLKLSGYLNHFYSVCYFDEKNLDWNVLSEQEYVRLKERWRKYCRVNNYPEEIKTVFHWHCMMLKTNLIYQTKYKKEDKLEESEMLELLQKGMKPMEVADKLVKELKLIK